MPADGLSNNFLGTKPDGTSQIAEEELQDADGRDRRRVSSQSPVPHRHQAHALLYVLEGSIVMQVKGGKEVTLTPGQTFYEGPNDIHTVGRNASATQPAKFIVVLVKDKGAPVLEPITPTTASLSASPKSHSGEKE